MKLYSPTKRPFTAAKMRTPERIKPPNCNQPTLPEKSNNPYPSSIRCTERLKKNTGIVQSVTRYSRTPQTADTVRSPAIKVARAQLKSAMKQKAPLFLTETTARPAPRTMATIFLNVQQNIDADLRQTYERNCTNFAETVTEANLHQIYSIGPIHAKTGETTRTETQGRGLKKTFSMVDVTEMIGLVKPENNSEMAKKQEILKEKIMKKVQEAERAKDEALIDIKQIPIPSRDSGLLASTNVMETPARFRRAETESPSPVHIPIANVRPKSTKRNTSASVFHKKRRSLNPSKFNNFLAKCAREQEAAEKDLVVVEKMQKQLEHDVGYMRDILNEREVKERQDQRKHAQHMATHKPLFVYGNTGSGRYFTPRGKDPLRICDLMLTINPRYKFLKGSFAKFLVKNDTELL